MRKYLLKDCVFLLIILGTAACNPTTTLTEVNEPTSDPVQEATATEIVMIDELDVDYGEWLVLENKAESPYSGICYLAYNTEKEPFDDVLVRQAFSFSLDREYLAQNGTCNNCNFRDQRPAITLAPEDFYFQKHGADFYDKWVNHEIPQFKKFNDFYQRWVDGQWVRDLKEEGYVLEEMSIQLGTSIENQQIAQLVGLNWRDYLGVDVEFVEEEMQDFNAWVTGENAPVVYVNCNYMDIASPVDLLYGLISGYYGDYIRWDVPDAYYQAVITGYKNNDLDAYLEAESMLVGEYAVIAPLFYYTVD